MTGADEELEGSIAEDLPLKELRTPDAVKNPCGFFEGNAYY